MPRLVIRRGTEVNYVSGRESAVDADQIVMADAGEDRERIAVIEDGLRGYLFRVWPGQTERDVFRGLTAEEILQDRAGGIAGRVTVAVVVGDYPDGAHTVDGYHGRVLLDGDDAPRIERGALVFRLGPDTERSHTFIDPRVEKAAGG